MRNLLACCIVLVLCLGARVGAAEYKLLTGDVYRGEIASVTDAGVVVRLEEGGFSPRVDFARFTDETLAVLAGDARTRKFVEPLIAPPEEEKALQEARQIVVKQPARIELPKTGRGLIAALTTPNGLILVGALFLANLFTAYGVARFRQQSVPLVCGLSAIFPVVGPIVFLALPKPADDGPAPAQAAETATVAMAPSTAENRVSSLGMARAGGGSAQEGLPRVFKRGETTINRRFFETQFPTFFRVIATEADRDLVIDIDAGKQSLTASRISRISANEIHFKTPTGVEASIEYGLIAGVTLRHKDHKA